METIYKYPLELKDDQTIEVPQGSKVLTVQVQDGKPCLWVLISDSEFKSIRYIEMFGTGHSIDRGERKYVGTFQLPEKGLVFHVFEFTPF